MMSENEFREYVLKNVPTRYLLNEYKCHVWMVYKGLCEMDGVGYDFGDYWIDSRCKIIVGKFAKWNPFKGKNFVFYYTLKEAKAELDNRENVE